jgi:hypothetical protein
LRQVGADKNRECGFGGSGRTFDISVSRAVNGDGMTFVRAIPADKAAVNKGRAGRVDLGHESVETAIRRQVRTTNDRKNR